MKKEALYELLHRSFHEELKEDEQRVLNEALDLHEDLQTEKQSILKLNHLLDTQQFNFKPFFASRVMRQIDVTQKPTGIFSWLNYAFMRISLPTMIAVFIWILAFWGTEGSLSMDGLLGVAGLSYDELVNEYLVSN